MGTSNFFRKFFGGSTTANDPEIVATKRDTFEAQKTIIALRTIAKKHDPLLRAATLKAYENQLKNPPKIEQPQRGPVLFFKSSLPIRVTPKAHDRIKRLKEHDKATKINFPPKMENEGKVTYIDNNGKEKLLGIWRVSTIEVESDRRKTDMPNVGLFVRTIESNNDLLEFVIRTPQLPAILRSSKLYNQGELSHKLNISAANKEKGAK